MPLKKLVEKLKLLEYPLEDPKERDKCQLKTTGSSEGTIQLVLLTEALCLSSTTK
jgi:hypothetical protein